MIERIFHLMNYFTKNEFIDDFLCCKKQVNNDFRFLIIFDYYVFEQRQSRVDKTHYD